MGGEVKRYGAVSVFSALSVFIKVSIYVTTLKTNYLQQSTADESRKNKCQIVVHQVGPKRGKIFPT